MRLTKMSALVTGLVVAVSAYAYTYSHTWNNLASVIAFNGSYIQLRGYNFSPSGSSVQLDWTGYSSPDIGVNAWNVKVFDMSGGGTGTLVYNSGDITVYGTSSSPGPQTLTIGGLTAGRPYLITLNDHGYGSSTGTWSYLRSNYTKLWW